MRLRWRGLACLCLCGVLVWFLADAGDVRADTKDALVLCARSVIPSLFPFLVISSLLLSLELFAGDSLGMFTGQSLGLFAVCIAVSYMLSGYYGLYSEQKIVYSKLRPEYIDKKANDDE